jgi:hypothetical protein
MESPTWATPGRDVIAGMIENEVPMLGIPFTVTTTFALPATKLGAGITILPLLQKVGATLFPPMLTVLLPWLAPKLPPLMVTAVPAAPVDGDRLLRVGVTVKGVPLLATPPTLTTMLPVPGKVPLGISTVIPVSLQLVGVSAAPLNVTTLFPWTPPNPIPVMWTGVPGGPAMGDIPLTLKRATLNATLLLATPFTVTPSVPLEAPLGMDA